MTWTLADARLDSRLLLGTSRYPSPAVLRDSIARSGTGVITVSLRRELPGGDGSRFFGLLKELTQDGLRVLPNTAGCRDAREAITTAQMARELFGTPWIKLEVIGDDYSLSPDPFGLVEAATVLVKDGFEVFPYMSDDLVLAARLRDAGCRILMPWGAPIGTGRGIVDPSALKALRARFQDVQLILDAGVGRPSHAAAAMELGFDGVLLNTAVATADDPAQMAEAFAKAIEAGRLGYEAGLMREREAAVPSTPVVGQAFRAEGFHS